MGIKSFIYLDTYKMYSISSQVFEGLTEYILDAKSNKSENVEEQKGPFASGRVMARIVEEQQDKVEKRFLHDYSYSLFEKNLSEKGKVLEITCDNLESEIKKISNYNFIKISGKLNFNDTKLIEETVKTFNDFGYALGYVTTDEETRNKIKGIRNQVSNITDRNNKIKAQANTSKINLIQLFTEKGLQLDEEFLQNLAKVLHYGYNGQFEIQIPLFSEAEHYLFSSLINRNMLREDEFTLIKKYSRETEKDFTIFGIIAQTNQPKKEVRIFEQAIEAMKEVENAKMRAALLNMIMYMTNLEFTFSGKLDYEIVIDPIAIYREI